MRPRRPPFRWAVRLYDRLCRRLHGLDQPSARVGPVLCLEIHRSRKSRTLPDGTAVRRGDRIAILHLNNAGLARLHARAPSPKAGGIGLRREFLASLAELARLAAPACALSEVRAYRITTILTAGLPRLGFAAERFGVLLPRWSAACQRYLFSALHPGTPPRLGGRTYRRAVRFWLSREALLRHHGPAATRLPVS